MTSFKKIACYFLFPPLLIPAALKNKGGHGKISRAASIAYGGYYSLALVVGLGTAIVNPLPPIETATAPKVQAVAPAKVEAKAPTIAATVEAKAEAKAADEAEAKAKAKAADEAEAKAKAADEAKTKAADEAAESGRLKREAEVAANIAKAAEEVSDRAAWTSDTPNAIVKQDTTVGNPVVQKQYAILKEGQPVFFTGEIRDGYAIIKGSIGKGYVPSADLQAVTAAQLLGR